MTDADHTSSAFVTVAVPLPIEGVFTYRVPEEIAPSAEPGRRALVPFGPRVLTGFITAVSDTPGDLDPARIKPIMDILDDAPLVDDRLLHFARWMANYYLCSLGEVLKAAVPYGSGSQSRLTAILESSTPPYTESLPVIEDRILALLESNGRMQVRTLERTLGRSVAGPLRSLAKRGVVRLEQHLTTREVRPKTERVLWPVPDAPETPRRAVQQIRCREVLAAYPEGIALAEFLERHGVSRGVVNALVAAGAAIMQDVPVTRRPRLLDQAPVFVEHPLTPAQCRCIDLIATEAASPKPMPTLLAGVTGSGKTRVYIELVRQTLARGQSALILVPEIALTPQTTRFFTSAFPETVAVLHSALSPGERQDMWRLIHDGESRIVIGPRSAVFAPLANPGIIIVDEEHDSSYKQDDIQPRYHGRDAAVMRGMLAGIPVVLGSATPSLESWWNVKTGKYRLAELTERIDNRPLPVVVTVDMRTERSEGNYAALSRTLREEILARIDRGEKSIVLINRRGFSSSVHCTACGYILTCPDCSVGLTWHASKGLAVCHLCGLTRLVGEHCPECGESKLRYKGMGTQRIEQELALIAGPDQVIRMDADTTQAHDGHFRLLEEFREGPKPILLGTQMVAKGLDIHDVTLVGVVSADLALFLPDFRAFERTFQLITQVAGRAGRGDRPGTVVLQTYNPENYAIAAAARQDFPAFAEQELAARKELAFPPFGRLILIEVDGPDSRQVQEAAERLLTLLSGKLPEDTEILGPVEAPIAKKRGRHRFHLLLKTQRPAAIRPHLRAALAEITGGTVEAHVDVDPLDLL